MSDFAILAARCESIEGISRPLSWDIWEAIGKPRVDEWSEAGTAPAYTDSLDAAMTLLPEGWRIAAICQREPWFCRVETLDFRSVTYGKGECWITDVTDGQEASAKGVTAALAVAAACLRARDTDGSGEAGETAKTGSTRRATAGAEGIAKNPPSGNPHDPR